MIGRPPGQLGQCGAGWSGDISAQQSHLSWAAAASHALSPTTDMSSSYKIVEVRGNLLVVTTINSVSKKIYYI